MTLHEKRPCAPDNDNAPSSKEHQKRRRGRFMGAVVVIFTILVLTYAFKLLREQTVATSAAGPLQVRTDLMRGQACHVVDRTIMGDCSDEEIAALQRQAR